MTTATLHPTDALVIVHLQKDFCPGGALPVPDGDRVVAVLNHWIDAAEHAGCPIVASRDWHPPNHMSFQPHGGPWPVHCVQQSPGADFCDELRLPERTMIVSTGQDPDREQYSSFDGTGLGETLSEAGIKRLWVGGLAQDVCVLASVLDARTAGFEVHLIVSATEPIDPEQGRQAMAEMQAAGVLLE